MHAFKHRGKASRVESRPNTSPYNLSFFELNGVAREQRTKVVKRVGRLLVRGGKIRQKKERVQTDQAVQAMTSMMHGRMAQHRRKR
jgi:hypothetical protein